MLNLSGRAAQSRAEYSDFNEKRVKEIKRKKKSAKKGLFKSKKL